MRNIMIAAIAALAFAGAAQANVCVKGVACGNTCIAKGKVCHITTTTKTATATTTTTTSSTPATTTNHCKTAKGKFVKCGTPGAVPA